MNIVKRNLHFRLNVLPKDRRDLNEADECPQCGLVGRFTFMVLFGIYQKNWIQDIYEGILLLHFYDSTQYFVYTTKCLVPSFRHDLLPCSKLW